MKQVFYNVSLESRRGTERWEQGTVDAGAGIIVVSNGGGVQAVQLSWLVSAVGTTTQGEFANATLTDLIDWAAKRGWKRPAKTVSRLEADVERARTEGIRRTRDEAMELAGARMALARVAAEVGLAQRIPGAPQGDDALYDAAREQPHAEWMRLGQEVQMHLENLRSSLAGFALALNQQVEDVGDVVDAPQPPVEKTPRAFTRKEMQDAFIDLLRGYVEYWLTEPRVTGVRDKLEGLAFSMLVILDGGTPLPGFNLIPAPHSSDAAYHYSQGKNWWVPTDIAGELHEVWHGHHR